MMQMLKLIFYDLSSHNHKRCFDSPPGEQYSSLFFPSRHAQSNYHVDVYSEHTMKVQLVIQMQGSPIPIILNSQCYGKQHKTKINLIYNTSLFSVNYLSICLQRDDIYFFWGDKICIYFFAFLNIFQIDFGAIDWIKQRSLYSTPFCLMSLVADIRYNKYKYYSQRFPVFGKNVQDWTGCKDHLSRISD